MQSEKHESLFLSLSDSMAKVTSAIHNGDAETLKNLAEENNLLLNELARAGFSKNPDLLDPVTEARNQVGEIISEIRKKRDEIGEELAVFVKRKNLVRAYAQNG